ncbi:glycosyl transferase family 2 [Xylanimonas cellulosilytica DSM 15894]|uniref:Glycosyl transferase family 2 n=1 Tax=Xylanimonas cellulosilytica (strain DSM 15894 / JCM 12276 / CECT 5975 / KCTC 9989 / LMG 20990 / NBRC 107835 / XIL07) TaxID=446471 RepID=D1BWZ3_XYLCX|nr:glycosyltransferase [Xylanimonas cellulosilytica]ACZ31561.1 glycosyl transferase family 2 [Xylanimonas cellulosilytica DSM 15894]
MTADSRPTSTDVAAVVVTFKRQDLLARLLDSFREMGAKPATIVIVDNENSPATAALVESLRADLAGESDVVYAPQETNTGGAGGFSAGTGIAYESGAQWIWLMDDDVVVLPGALERLRYWTDRTDADLAAGLPLAQTHGVYQGQRLNYDGSPFYWQYHFLNRLAIPNPIAPRPFGAGKGAPRTGRVMNTACFEGGIFHRDVVTRIGLPDPRFFIYWDDTIYGYLAAKITRPLIVSDLILQRTRELAHHKIGTTRKLNTTSELARYHILRNRGYMAHYLREHGEYHPVVFGIGTAATVAKEVIRLTLTSERWAGLKTIVRGWRDARKILQDTTWTPMPPLGG